MSLQKGFFMTEPFNPYPYWDGYVFFESGVPDTYSITMDYDVKCGIILVGAGGGGACAWGTLPGGTYDSSLAGGGSGGYSGLLDFELYAGDVLSIIVGAAGTGSVVMGNTTSGTNGNLSQLFVNGVNILTANGGNGGKIVNTTATGGNGGTGTTSDGLKGQSWVGTGTSHNVSGGGSVYNNYGTGGGAGYKSASNGINGYVKIYAIMPS